jgi:hypothetical protein
MMWMQNQGAFKQKFGDQDSNKEREKEHVVE